MLECVAAEGGWPQREWDYLLAPFLTGEAQQACSAMSEEEATEYSTMKYETLS